ncbi:MAG: MBL fold metallo-hydrolase [Candidatus Woesearchaeota archaeon]
MKLYFHGGAREVGRSCIELETSGDRYLIDAGLKFREDGFDYPVKVFEMREINGLFLSHAHLDHTGSLPLFEHYNLICPIFATAETKYLSKILLKDSYRVARIRHLHPAYGNTELKKVSKTTKIVSFKKRYAFRKLFFTFFNAGHIPGSASILFELEDKRLLYTGDFNTKNTELMKPADVEYNNIDILITESTYGNTTLPEREETMKKFLDKIEETIKRGGSALIPVFALGRGQEILLMLGKRKWNVPIVYDGMVTKITNKILSTPDNYVAQQKELKNLMSKVELVSSERHRGLVMKKQAIIVTTSGMVQGGPILNYVKNMWGNPKHSILLTGFQCKRTNGRLLLEEGYLFLDGWKTYVKCEVKEFQFSGHIDRPDLEQYIKKVNPKVVIIQHGDESEAQPLFEWCQNNTNAKIYFPKVNDELEF